MIDEYKDGGYNHNIIIKLIIITTNMVTFGIGKTNTNRSEKKEKEKSKRLAKAKQTASIIKEIQGCKKCSKTNGG